MPSTALREVSLLQMLSESIYVVRRGPFQALPPRLLELEPSPRRCRRLRGDGGPSAHSFRLLNVEHVEEDGKAMLYLVRLDS